MGTFVGENNAYVETTTISRQKNMQPSHPFNIFP